MQQYVSNPAVKLIASVSLQCTCFLPQENDSTLKGRVEQSDAREMQSFYQHYYKKYIQALQNAADKADRSEQPTHLLFLMCPPRILLPTHLWLA